MDEKYLIFNDKKISEKSFNDNIKNDLEKFVKFLPVSKNKQKAIIEAFSEMLNAGITGFSDGSTQIADMSKILNYDENAKFNPYGYASTFVQKRLEQLSKNVSEEPKQERTKFSNEYFNESLKKHISDARFGGLKVIDWNSLDKPSEYGISTIKNRRNEFILNLSDYFDTLNAADIDFTNSPYKTYEEFQRRKDAVLLALRDNDDEELNETSIAALQRLGIDPDVYFSTGANDLIEGTNVTRRQAQMRAEQAAVDAEAAEAEKAAKAREAEAKKVEEIKKAEAKKAAELKNKVILPNYTPSKTLITLAGKTKTIPSNILASFLNDYGSIKASLLNLVALRHQTPVNSNYIHNILENSIDMLDDISDTEYEELQKYAKTKGREKSKFKKYPEVNNLIYDVENKVAYILSPLKHGEHLLNLDYLDAVKEYKGKKHLYRDISQILTGVGTISTPLGKVNVPSIGNILLAAPVLSKGLKALAIPIGVWNSGILMGKALQRRYGLD